MYAVVDIETTGGSYKTGKITEIAILHFNGFEVTDKFVSLVNPEMPISWFVKKLTGIDDKMVSTAPKFHEVAAQIAEFTENRIFVAHNINFDYNFVKQEFQNLGQAFDRKKICTVKLSRKVIPDLPSYSLGKLCESLQIDVFDRHRAEGDAQATALLMRRLLQISNRNQIKIL
ncbi:MAG TPA: 3'-5' exonuclease [Bacteroidia bacterium]|nr:3'-5' exonuclease [Bacteroidia bacterium]